MLYGLGLSILLLVDHIVDFNKMAPRSSQPRSLCLHSVQSTASRSAFIVVGFIKIIKWPTTFFANLLVFSLAAFRLYAFFVIFITKTSCVFMMEFFHPIIYSTIKAFNLHTCPLLSFPCNYAAIRNSKSIREDFTSAHILPNLFSPSIIS